MPKTEESLVEIQHLATKKKSKIPASEWDKIKADPNWKNVFKEVPAPPVPPEVKALADKPPVQKKKTEGDDSNQ